MPRGDGTGPMGIGPMTGRMAGNCIGYAPHEFVNQGFGYGSGRGFGSGKGCRRMSCITGIPGCKTRYAHTSAVLYRQEIDEQATLKNQEDILEKQLQLVRNRLKDFDEQK